VSTESDPNANTNIVVGFDFSEQAELALREALSQARLRESSTIHVIGVLEPTKRLGRLTHDKVDFTAAEAAQSSIEDAVAKVTGNIEREPFALFIHTRIGKPVDEIVLLARETDADLVIVGTHGRKGLHRITGSVAERVMRRAGCPVLVVRPVTHHVPAPEDAAFVPEPPCPDCVDRRIETKGREWWCPEHAEVHPRPSIWMGRRRSPTMDEWQTYNQ